MQIVEEELREGGGRLCAILRFFDAAGYDLEMIPIRAAGSIGTYQIYVL